MDHLLQASNLISYSECPEELREAICGLIYAQPRCDQLLELHDIRKIITSRLGKRFVSSILELQDPGINPNIIRTLSTKQPSADMMKRVARDLAKEYGIEFGMNFKEPINEEKDYSFSSSKKVNVKYKNASEAALEAFTSAAYAAVAAKEAMVLSRRESRGHGSSSSSSSME